MTSAEPVSVHMPVLNLLVPRLWRVGRVTFRPRGWLRRRIAKLGEGTEGTERWFYDDALVPLREWRWATAEVTMPTDARGAADFYASRDAIRDAIAVLRLYQRAVAPLHDMDIQTFGLVADIGSDLAYSWQTTGDRLSQYGRNMLGVLGEWESRAPTSTHSSRGQRSLTSTRHSEPMRSRGRHGSGARSRASVPSTLRPRCCASRCG